MKKAFLALVVAALGLVAYVAWGLPWPSDVRALARTNPGVTSVMRQREREANEKGRPPRRLQSWVPLSRISRHLVHAVIAAEDQKFFGHEGVDWEAIKESVEHNRKKGRFARGGSTITQQLAKNLFFTTRKDPVRKLRELVAAHWLESELSKARILELYLNVIEWGDGVYGAQAAAQRYYGRSASALDPGQAAGLAAMIPNPRRINPRANPSRHARAQRRVLWLMAQAGYLGRSGLGSEPPPPEPVDEEEDEGPLPETPPEPEATPPTAAPSPPTAPSPPAPEGSPVPEPAATPTSLAREASADLEEAVLGEQRQPLEDVHLRRAGERQRHLAVGAARARQVTAAGAREPIATGRRPVPHARQRGLAGKRVPVRRRVAVAVADLERAVEAPGPARAAGAVVREERAAMVELEHAGDGAGAWRRRLAGSRRLARLRGLPWARRSTGSRSQDDGGNGYPRADQHRLGRESAPTGGVAAGLVRPFRLDVAAFCLLETLANDGAGVCEGLRSLIVTSPNGRVQIPFQLVSDPLSLFQSHEGVAAFRAAGFTRRLLVAAVFVVRFRGIEAVEGFPKRFVGTSLSHFSRFERLLCLLDSFLSTPVLFDNLPVCFRPDAATLERRERLRRPEQLKIGFAGCLVGGPTPPHSVNEGPDVRSCLVIPRNPLRVGVFALRPTGRFGRLACGQSLVRIRKHRLALRLQRLRLDTCRPRATGRYRDRRGDPDDEHPPHGFLLPRP